MLIVNGLEFAGFAWRWREHRGPSGGGNASRHQQTKNERATLVAQGPDHERERDVREAVEEPPESSSHRRPPDRPANGQGAVEPDHEGRDRHQATEDKVRLKGDDDAGDEREDAGAERGDAARARAVRVHDLGAAGDDEREPDNHQSPDRRDKRRHDGDDAENEEEGADRQTPIIVGP